MTRSATSRRKRMNEQIRQLAMSTGAESIPPDSAFDTDRLKWIDALMTLSMSRRSWEGFPKELDPRYMEYLLVTDGRCLICEDKDGLRVMRLSVANGWDVQANYTDVQGMGANGEYVPNLDPSNSVVVWDNLNRHSIIPFLYQWAKELAEYDKQIKINLHQQGAMFIPMVSPDNVEDGKKIMQGFGTSAIGQLVLKPEKGSGDIIEPKLLQTGVVPKLDKLYEARAEKLAEIYTMLGIDNVPVEKQERLVTSEAESGDDLVSHYRWGFMQPCEAAVKEVNRIFGLNTSVTWNEKVERENDTDDKAGSSEDTDQ